MSKTFDPGEWWVIWARTVIKPLFISSALPCQIQDGDKKRKLWGQFIIITSIIVILNNRILISDKEKNQQT